MTNIFSTKSIFWGSITVNVKNSLADANFGSANQHLSNTLSKAVRRLLYANVAIAVGGSVIGIPSVALADSTTASADDDLTELVITARRKAFIAADERKREAETSLDSIVADEAGKLPDNSITEVLQRVAGVQMTRFDLGIADAFTSEGNGIQIRGLSGVAGRLNGREVFSANGGWGLQWDAVTPELMSAVDVYKASTVDMIEGGTGGTIDLRTKMPFDYGAGLQLNGSASLNYGDLSKKTSPRASVLISDRWNTGIGEVGALLDVAYSRQYDHNDGFHIDPYLRTVMKGDVVNGSQTYYDAYIPSGYQYGLSNSTSDRYGIYTGLQWAPSDDLTISQTAFLSRHNSESSSHGFGGGASQTSWGYANWCGKNPPPAGDGFGYCHTGVDGGTDAFAVDPTNSVFDANNALVKSPNVFPRDPNTLMPSAGGYHTGGYTGYSKSSGWTSDLSTSFTWKVADRLSLKGAAQFVRSIAKIKGISLGSGLRFPGGFSLDTSQSFPKLAIVDGTSSANALTNLGTYNFSNQMPNQMDNVGTLKSFNVDGDFTVSESGFFRSIRAGVRYADRRETDRNYYAWSNLCNGEWDGCDLTQHNFNQAQPGDVEFVTFNNFFRGKLQAPTGLWFPSVAMAKRLDPVQNRLSYRSGAPLDCSQVTDSGFGNTPYNDGLLCLHDSWKFSPVDASSSRSINRAAYLMVRFAVDHGLPLDGNAGVRLVSFTNNNYGYYDQTGLYYNYVRTEVIDNGDGTWKFGSQLGPTERRPATPVVTGNPIDGNVATSGSSTATKGVPAINLKLKPTKDIQIRLAYNVTFDQPNIYDSRASGSVHIDNFNVQGGSGATATNCTKHTDTATGKTYCETVINPNFISQSRGDPTLKPQYATNYDLSFEWYPSSGSSTHLSLFRRDIKNYLVHQRGPADVIIYQNDGSIQTSTQISDRVFNTDNARVKGIEFGARAFFDKLPEPFNHLGIDANYTYLDSVSAGETWFDINGGQHKGTPMRGLAPNSYNLQLMYEAKSLSVRLAWNWRDKVYQGANLGGNYTYLGPPTAALNSQAGINFSLPTYEEAYGQLDFGTEYRFNKNIGISFNIANLINTTPRTFQSGYLNVKTGNYDVSHPYSWYAADRRFNIGINWRL